MRAFESLGTRTCAPLLKIAGAVILAGGVLPFAGAKEALIAVAPPGQGGAIGLTLAPNLSFTDDSSSNFPIRGEDLGDGRIASDRPTAIFFGTSHCWNTNREAERFVALYAVERENVRFLVVDIERPSAEQRALMSRFYRGYIPTLAFLDRSGRVVYNQAGETTNARGDISRLREILGKASSPVR